MTVKRISVEKWLHFYVKNSYIYIRRALTHSSAFWHNKKCSILSRVIIVDLMKPDIIEIDLNLCHKSLWKPIFNLFVVFWILCFSNNLGTILHADLFLFCNIRETKQVQLSCATSIFGQIQFNFRTCWNLHISVLWPSFFLLKRRFQLCFYGFQTTSKRFRVERLFQKTQWGNRPFDLPLNGEVWEIKKKTNFCCSVFHFHCLSISSI